MTTRRSFLKSTAMVSTGLLIAPELFACAKTQYIGLQLFTVRELMAKDPVNTLSKVAKIGFNSIEGATYTGTEKFYGMTPAIFKKTLNDNGLNMFSAHYMLGESTLQIKGTIFNDWQKAVDDAAAVGLKYMVCAFLFDTERGNLDHYKQTADKLNKAGELCKKAGIQLCYHNHAFEFDAQDNQYPYDLLLNNTDADLVKMEMDLYWIYKAKQDPVVWFNKYPGRFPLWHIKDMDKTPKAFYTEVGNGVIPFKEVFKHAKTAGLKYFYNEQDETPGDPLVSIAQSYIYIKENLVL
ncbi:sugar phosphate isomerase/epimerase [Mucilaginibacter sp. 5C4]|uniref:sugar phosphate isomerase/epimerase family protein n=2 Tax=unclassified Mucilaginibacter TaxID=2617802 RepID=UPI002AC8E3DD|nr:sugar phosphate isomerase/epimerase [Mucilaginibacter sp. 5C4]MEB0277432.1 sugar phosphate isomerase/epimerase [Mucilaginibacter sp. 10B2]WPX24938.1 sugar phosphate isomerase/epimerase [Mucilaginibacter sp. 5C4]